jgi:hypothetical protein
MRLRTNEQLPERESAGVVPVVVLAELEDHVVLGDERQRQQSAIELGQRAMMHPHRGTHRAGRPRLNQRAMV